ncbi:MAG: molybdopterin-guanine dinucleotide biosynthesis protein B [Methylotetracoccus sp.]
MHAPGAEPRVPLIGFAAPSGTGKTTLLIALIPLLRAQGLRIGVIKHAHHAFAIDKPGKDSYELRAAGAATVMLSAAGRRATISELPDARDPELVEEVRHFDTDGIDLILVEGFKHERFPKIELHRHALGSQPMFPDDDSIVAIATDGPLPVPAAIPILDLNRPEQIAEFIRQQLL